MFKPTRQHFSLLGALASLVVAGCSLVIDTDTKKLGGAVLAGDGDTSACGQACDDGIPCTVDTCDAKHNCVHTPSAMLCDDKIGCTDDVCDPVKGCVSQPDDARCQFCAPGGHCDTVHGGCVGSTAPRNCDDKNPCTEDSCSVAEMMCIRAPLDQDGDGFTAQSIGGTSCGGDDCNDSNAEVHPGATEVCGDGLDNDCNGKVDDNCQPLPDACSAAELIQLSATTTAVIQSNFMSRASQLDSCGAKDTPDAVYRVAVTGVSDIVFDSQGSATPVVLSVGETCDDTGFGLGCALPLRTGHTRLALHRYDPGMGGGELLLLVEPSGAGQRGDFRVSVSVTPAVADSCLGAPFDYTGFGTVIGYMGALGSLAGSCQTVFGGGAPEGVFAISGTDDGNVSFSVTSDGFAPSMYARTLCGGGLGSVEYGCSPSTGGTSGSATLNLQLGATDKAFLMVDSGAAGARYTLTCDP